LCIWCAEPSRRSIQTPFSQSLLLFFANSRPTAWMLKTRDALVHISSLFLCLEIFHLTKICVSRLSFRLSKIDCIYSMFFRACPKPRVGFSRFSALALPKLGQAYHMSDSFRKKTLPDLAMCLCKYTKWTLLSTPDSNILVPLLGFCGVRPKVIRLLYR
jgi:hypothetical protein